MLILAATLRDLSSAGKWVFEAVLAKSLRSRLSRTVSNLQWPDPQNCRPAVFHIRQQVQASRTAGMRGIFQTKVPFL